eukprot:99174-Pyramimonas_sp.AAC.1
MNSRLSWTASEKTELRELKRVYALYVYEYTSADAEFSLPGISSKRSGGAGGTGGGRGGEGGAG